MSKKLQHPVTIKIRGVDYILLFNIDAVERAEDLTGKSLLTGIEQKYVLHPPISFVKAMLFSALLPVQPDTTYADASSLVDRDNIIDIWGKVIEAWFVQSPDPEPQKENPTPAQS
jgi:hypothetical protein